MIFEEKTELKEVGYYFEQICKIPHGSGNIEQISNYLVDFAKKEGLTYYQDEWKNVMVIKEATEGYENEPALMLQGHMDMVAVKKPTAEIDMKKDGLVLQTEGDWLYAKDTSLGGDDGIALAYSLAILAAEDLKHPRLEVLFTVDEETGMEGVRNIDVSMLKSKRLLNLDSEEEGIILAGCAGGARVDLILPVNRISAEGIAYEVKVAGLTGGHSGAEIHKERGNAIHLLGRLLDGLAETEYFLAELIGGLADNAIPREAAAVLVVPEGEQEQLKTRLAEMEKQFKCELQTKDPGVELHVTARTTTSLPVLSKESAKQLVRLIFTAPWGIQAMSGDIHGLVETSLNPGILRLDEKEAKLTFSVRSSLESAKEEVISRLKYLGEWAGAACEIRGSYPGWAYRKNSPLRETAIQLYRKMYGKEPKVEAIHAGLECGLLSAKIPDLDCISIGPDMENIHTTEERLSISSTARVWNYILQLISQKQIPV